MFVRVSTLVLAIAVGAIAGTTPSAVNECNTGSIQCCDQYMTANDASSLPGLSFLGNYGDTPVGIDCSPIGDLLLGSGSSCTAQTVCCDNQNTSNDIQVVSFNCSPINVNA